jgi:GntR family transcriptional repressor for pyruvate dehydrogenase complex
MPVKPIERIHVGDAVFAQMKNLIMSGEWQPGGKIPSENALTRQLGVSRISVRAALERLKSLGLIEARQGSGTYVRAGHPDALFDSIIPVYVQGNRDMFEILQFRQVIECEAARLACRQMSERDLERLQRLYGRMKQAIGDAGQVASLDLEFHLQIVRLSQNRYLYQVEQILQDILSQNFRKVIDTIGPDLGIRYHELILAAFQARDGQQAYDLMQDHIGRTIERLRDASQTPPAGTGT